MPDRSKPVISGTPVSADVATHRDPLSPAALAKAWCAWSLARKATALAAKLRSVATLVRRDADAQPRSRGRLLTTAGRAEGLAELAVSTALGSLRQLHSPPKPPRRRRKRAGQLELLAKESKS
jgi:hypothetical protein